MKRMTVAGCTIIVLLLFGGMSAFALISAVTVDKEAELSVGRTVATVTGLVQCTAGDDVNISVTLVQTHGRELISGFGNAQLTCTGGADPWTVLVPTTPVQSWQPGQATVIVGAVDLTDSDTQSIRTTIHLKN